MTADHVPFEGLRSARKPRRQQVTEPAVRILLRVHSEVRRQNRSLSESARAVSFTAARLHRHFTCIFAQLFFPSLHTFQFRLFNSYTISIEFTMIVEFQMSANCCV